MKYYCRGLFDGEPWKAIVAFSGTALKRTMHTYEGIEDLDGWESMMRDEGVLMVDEANNEICPDILLAMVDNGTAELQVQHERQPVI